MMCKDQRENIIALKNVLISKATCHIGRYIQLNDWTYQANGMMNKCCRCGYEWAPRSKEPLRCPSCKSTRWNKETIKDKCLRCGAEWVQRGSESPKYCPICHSSMWNSEKVTYTCPKCGLTRTLRSNSRIGLCPVCDRYVDSRPKTQFDDFRPKEAGVSESTAKKAKALLGIRSVKQGVQWFWLLPEGKDEQDFVTDNDTKSCEDLPF